MRGFLVMLLAGAVYGQTTSTLNLFSPNPPIDPSLYYIPGNGSPAVSTADYYHMDGLYWFRPYDLNAMGTPGRTIAASRGRYFWLATPDHPDPNYSWAQGTDFMGGYSNDPGVPPATFGLLFRHSNDIVLGGTQHYGLYQAAWLVYNLDDPATPFYIYAEGTTTGGSPSRQHEEGYAKSADLLTWAMQGPSHPTATFAQWSSFQRPIRNATGDWTSTGLQVGFTPNAFGSGTWTSADGQTFTPGTTLINVCLPPNTTGTHGVTPCPDTPSSMMGLGSSENVTYNSQLYAIVNQDSRNADGGMYVAMVPIDSSNNVLASPAVIRISAKYDGVYPGPGYLQNVSSYLEDGVLHMWASHGFAPSSSNNQLVSGATYANGGGLWQQFIDYYTKVIDPTAAADAAPIGVAVSAASGTVTLTWLNALPNNTYRVYRSPDNSAWTNLGNVTGATTTDAPGTGQWYYKVVTLHSGVEKQSRTVLTYASSASGLVNSHINRILKDGADATTIDATWLTAAVNWLSATGLTGNLLFWSDPAFGVKRSGSVISKIYDLGTTRLPRGGDYTPTTGNTTYSATGVNSLPAWVNGTTSSYAYFGSGRLNNIRRKYQITFVANYQKSGTAQATLLASGEFHGMALYNSSGSPGAASFYLEGASTSLTAVAGALTNGNPHIIGGTFDGTNVTAYADGVAGVSLPGLAANADLVLETRLRGIWGNTSLIPFVGSGALDSKYNINLEAYVFDESQALFSASDLILFDKALTAAQMASLTVLLQTHAIPPTSTVRGVAQLRGNSMQR